MPKIKNNRRKNYFIKKEYQRSFIFQFVGLIILEAVIMAGLLIFVTKGTLTTTYYGTHLEITSAGNFFFGRFVLIALAAGAAIAIAGWLIFLYCSHKIAGPLYRFEKTIDEISRGNVSFRVKLREDDQLDDIQPYINNLLENIDHRVKVLKTGIEGAESAISELEAKGSPDAIDRLKDVIAHLKTTIDYFKTSPK